MEGIAGWELNKWAGVEARGGWFQRGRGADAFSADVGATLNVLAKRNVTPYVGAGIGNAGIEVDGNDPDLGDIDDLEFDGDDVGYKLFAGYRVMPYFGVEASWNDFGAPDDSREVGNVQLETEFETDGFDFSLMGIAPIG